MKTTVDIALEQFLIRQNPDEKPVYMYFKSDEDEDKVPGNSSVALTGRVFYKTEDKVKSSQSLFVKQTIDLKDFKEVSRSIRMGGQMKCFMNEIYFYTTVRPFFESYRSLNHMLPKYYDGFMDAHVEFGSGTLLFENLKDSGFASSQQKYPLDYPHLSLMMRKLGEFHAYSFEVKKMNPVYVFHSLAALFSNIMLSYLLTKRSAITARLKLALQPLRDDPSLRQALIKIDAVLDDFRNFILNCELTDAENPLVVLCHRSYRRDNVMFRYEDGVPVDMKIVDWQTCQLSSVARDIVFTLYWDTDQETREKYWDDLLDDYHAGLCGAFPFTEVPTKKCINDEVKSTLLSVLPLVALMPQKTDVQKSSALKNEENIASNTDPLTVILKDILTRVFL